MGPAARMGDGVEFEAYAGLGVADRLRARDALIPFRDI